MSEDTCVRSRFTIGHEQAHGPKALVLGFLQGVVVRRQRVCEEDVEFASGTTTFHAPKIFYMLGFEIIVFFMLTRCSTHWGLR